MSGDCERERGARWAWSFLVAAVLGAGWWAAAESEVALADQAGAAAAALLILSRTWLRPATAPGISGAVAAAGAAAGLALGWVWPAALALAWLLGRREAHGLPRWRMAAFAGLAVPWIATDGAVIGWWFRQTGAWAAAGIFDLSGLSVTRTGTSLQVEDQPLAVDAACAGLDTLQITLVSGLWMAEILRTERAWVKAALLLPFLAWVANTLRIVLLGAVAVAAGHEAARGWFHEWGGLAVVVMMFVAAGGWVFWLRRGEAKLVALNGVTPRGEGRP